METNRIEEAEALASLSALAQQNRLEVFRLLVRAGASGLSAGAIAKTLGLPASSLSFHLSNLTQGALITSQREGRSIIYFANFERMRGLVAYLLENCCEDECAPFEFPTELSADLKKEPVP